ncbi:MAG: two-component sensor histidine kinase [Planctomycetes bacterium]|nr:two-component sensor histidine kinase [Planctomycetota bacterium]
MAPEESSAPPSPERAEFLARVAGGLAHEIKNPLSTMAINLALLEEEFLRSAKARDPENAQPNAREQRYLKRVGTLQREVRRLENIVEDFLRYARGGVVNRRPEDFCALIREVLEFVEPEDQSQGIRHHVELPSALPLVRIDAAAMRQVILNLLVNARQAMTGGGELIVRLQREKNYALLTITDTGVGMNEHELAHCFDTYWSTKREGSGLGLATARRIVEEHGGKISVFSEPGRGTSFSIVLPLVVEITGKREDTRSDETREAPRDVEAEPADSPDATAAAGEAKQEDEGRGA